MTTPLKPYSGLYQRESPNPYKISRSAIESFLGCRRCFYLEKRLDIYPAGGLPFSLNSAVDHLLKKEFDIHRARGEPHPLMKKYGIKAVPLTHKDLDQWRSNPIGVQYYHEKTNLLIFGAVDDVWITPSGELIVVDYKATSKKGEVSLDADWQIGYRRQMDVYQWLLKKNGFKVSRTGYFVYCNGKKDRRAFDGKLEFDVKILPYEGSHRWIEGALRDIKRVLNASRIPAYSKDCVDCEYQQAILTLATGRPPK